MPTYGKENFKESNVNYLNKDFTALKASLMNYAKSYFPNTYRDFNETSPGMMLLEMNAYVGDVLSFYIDQQYREMLLPLAEERRNIITMAKMFGYKVKPIVPAYVDLTFTSNVNASSGDVSKVDYSNASVFDAGIQVQSSVDSNIIFTTLEPIDFKIEQDGDTDTIGTTAASGLASTYTLSRTVRAVSATEKTISFQVGIPQKFKTLTIPDTNVIDIISCVDSNNNNWYEVDFLAQDKVPIETHYTDDLRPDAYTDEQALRSDTAVPFSLTYITSPKRFTRETNQDNTTSLVFGNGVLKNGTDGTIDQGYIDMEQVGIIIPGQTNDLNESINPLLGDEYSTLGETPNNTTLTITYRVGGGIGSNVPSGDLSTGITALSSILPAADGGARLNTVTNNAAARGGKDEEDTIEIKERAKAFFSTQNRCVTKEDYEARVMNIPAKFGNIAKVYVTRSKVGEGVNYSSAYNNLGATAVTFNNNFLSGLETIANNNSLTQIQLSSAFNNLINNAQNDIVEPLDTALEGGGGSLEAIRQAVLDLIQDMNDRKSSLESAMDNEELMVNQINSGRIISYNELAQSIDSLVDGTGIDISTINIYVLGYDNQKQLVGNPHFTDVSLPNTLTSNIKSYLNNFKLLTDVITINDGYIVNFGVFFDVIAEKYSNKQQVKINCIEKIKDYFNISKMQFNQPIYKSQLEFELMGVEGVRSIGHVTITQEIDYFDGQNGDVFESPLYTYSFSNQGDGSDIDGDGVPDGGFVIADGGTTGYGYKYDFKNALSEDNTIIVPPNTATPTVFELKNPNQNIQGRVR